MDPKFEPVMPGRQSPLSPLPASGPAVAEERVVVPISQNTVLRNTYWLLALSMLPTIAGAFVGMQLNFFAFFRASPVMAPLVMFGVMLGAVTVFLPAWWLTRSLGNHGLWLAFTLFNAARGLQQHLLFRQWVRSGCLLEVR